jgi:hypothetical protein
MRLTFSLVTVFGLSLLPLAAQVGSKPAPVIEILKESIKEGRGAAHEKVESDYTTTFRKANFPGHWFGLSAMSGSSEVWFIEPMPSFGASEEYDQIAQKEPLKSAIALLDSRDGELRSASHTMWAVFRPDLSYGVDKFNRAKIRYIMAATFRVRLGKEEDFMTGGKAYFGAFQKAGIDETVLGYQVVAGAPAGTFLFMTMMPSMKELDGQPARMQAVRQAMGADAYDKLMKGGGDTFVSIENTLLQVRAGMSYPSQETIDADPAFWKPKPAVKPATATVPATAEKKAAQ